MTQKIFGIETAIIVVFLPLAGLVAGLVLITNLVLIPKVSEFREMLGERKEILAKTNTVKEKTRYLASIDQASLREKAKYLSGALLPENNSYLVVNNIGKLAEKNGFQIDGFKLSMEDLSTDDAEIKNKKKSDFLKLPVDVKLVGMRSNYLALLKNIENSLPVLSIDAFEMKSAGGEMAEINMKVSAFYMAGRTQTEVAGLTLSDLVLNKAEAEVVSTIEKYQILSEINGGLNLDQGVYVKHERTNPFTL